MNEAKSRKIAAEWPLRVKLALADDGMARVLEDLIQMLHRRGLINRDDLPPEALAKLKRRTELRSAFAKATADSETVASRRDRKEKRRGMKRPWTVEEVLLVRRLAILGNQAPAIAMRVGQRFRRRTTAARIRRMCREYGIRLRRGPPRGNLNAAGRRRRR